MRFRHCISTALALILGLAMGMVMVLPVWAQAGGSDETIVDVDIEDADPSILQAQQLFNAYVSLEKAFDKQVADLYSDTAIIKSTRKYPDGHTETLHIPPQRYKAMLRQLMPMAKALNDRGDYSNVKFIANKDGRVRIEATRYSLLKKYSAPVILLVGPDNAGKWVIHEEYSETQP